MSEHDLGAGLEDRSRFEILLCDLSATLINVCADRLDLEIRNVQERICDCLGVDQCCLWQVSPDEPDVFILTHLYSTREAESPPLSSLAKGERSLRWPRRKLEASETQQFPKNAEATPERVIDRETWTQFDFDSTLTFPLSAGGGPIYGVLDFNATEDKTTLPEPLLRRLQLIAQIFANALARKHYEQVLRDSKARLNLAAASANLGLWTLEPISGQFWTSGKVLEMFGLSPDVPDESLNFASFLALVHTDDREDVSHAIGEAMKSGNEATIEYRILQPKGAQHWMVSRARRQLGKLGEPDRLTGVSADITELKNAEAVKLMQSAIVESAEDAIISNDFDGMITTWNRGAQQLFGYSEQEAVGQQITIIVPSELWTEEKAILSRLKAGESLSRYETIRIAKDRKRVHVSLTLSPIRDSCGKVIGISNISRDISSQKRSEVALRESEERFRTVANTAPVMIWMSATDKRCTFVNQHWLEFTGRSIEDSLGEGWIQCVHPEDLNSCLGTYHSAFDARTEFQIEYRLRRYDTEYRWVFDRGQPRFQPNGEFEGYIGCAVDVTDSKQLALELQNSYEQVRKLTERVQAESDYLKEEIRIEGKYDEIVGQSDALRKVFQKLEQVARTDSVVLITGETGTGKELIARAIHNRSNRCSRVMVKVDCASLPASLIESELFGREKGAYTGALTRQIGRLEMADGSTLFLDEIGELPLDLQAKLLRVVQDGNFERLGSPKTLSANIRVIAATHRDLVEEVRAGRFREDLFYRLHVFPIHIPPLRERAQDIPLLVRAFIEQFEKKMDKNISLITRDAMHQLQSYFWPGNIRELRNVIEQSVILTNGIRLNLHMPQHLSVMSPPTLKEVEHQHIVSILKKTNWRIKGPGGAAQILGMKSSTLYSIMRRLEIPPSGRRGEISS